MKMKNIISRLPLWPLLAAALFSSCTLDERIWGDDSASRSDKLTIRIAVPCRAVPGNARPATRALGATDEYAVSEVTVLAFDEDDKQFYGRYPGFVTNGPTGTGGAAADMTFQVSLPVGEFDLMVVVNGNTMLNAAQAAGNLDKGDAQATVTEAIQATMDTSGWDVDATPTLLPMWGYKMGVVITEATTSLADPINLTRMVAKVDIQLDSALIAAGKFKLQSVRVYNYMEQGRLIPDIAGANAAVWDGITFAELKAVTTPTLSATPSKAASANEWIDYTLAPNATALERSIYLFEAAAGVNPIADPVNYLLNPCLVIGGSYNNGPTTYYRIDFAKDTDTDPNDNIHNWQYLPLMRNNSYTITVTDITGNGHGSQDDALKSIPVNIEANIIDWVENDLAVEGSNGIYKLKVSQTTYDFDSYARNGSSNDNLLTIVTDYDGGWTATSDAAWLTLSTASESSANDPLGTDVRLLVEAYTGNDERTGTVTVAAGNIRLKVKVVQVSSYLRVIDMLTGQQVTSFSFPAKNIQPRQFKVEWSPVEENVNLANTAGNPNDLDWTAEGSLPATLSGGSYVFMVDPTDISDPELALDPFINKTASLGFTLGTKSATLELTQGNEAVIPQYESYYLLDGSTIMVTIRANVPWEAKLAEPENGANPAVTEAPGTTWSGSGNPNQTVSIALTMQDGALLTWDNGQSLIEVTSKLGVTPIPISGWYGYIFIHEDETWLARMDDMGPYNYNAIAACPASYTRPTLAVAESMRTQTVHLNASRNYWSSQVSGVGTVPSPSSYPNPTPAEGSSVWTGQTNVTGAYNVNTTTIPMQHGTSKRFVWTTVANGINFDELVSAGTGGNGPNSSDVWQDISTSYTLVTSAHWISSLSVNARIQYRTILNQDYDFPQGPLFTAAYVKLTAAGLPGHQAHYEYRSPYPEALGALTYKSNWTGSTSTYTASAYVRCVKQLVP